jgi:hypothetical protein
MRVQPQALPLLTYTIVGLACKAVRPDRERGGEYRHRIKDRLPQDVCAFSDHSRDVRDHDEAKNRAGRNDVSFQRSP